jgi:hypothetical protein
MYKSKEGFYMAYYYKAGVIVPFVQKFYKQMIVVVAAIFVASMAAMTFSASAVVLQLEEPAKAAPSVAAELLKGSDISNRYGKGKSGGNHVADVAKHMGPGTNFDGVAKEDIEEYECTIVKFLRNKNPEPAMVTSSYDNCYELVPVDEVEVPSTSESGVFTSYKPEVGAEYKIIVSGIYKFANWGFPYGYADAEWSNRLAQYTPDNTAGWIKGEDYFSSECGLDVQVDNSCVDWGNFNPENVYELPYVGTGNIVKFHIYDNVYSDNQGTLNVKIYKKL